MTTRFDPLVQSRERAQTKATLGKNSSVLLGHRPLFGGHRRSALAPQLLQPAPGLSAVFARQSVGLRVLRSLRLRHSLRHRVARLDPDRVLHRPRLAHLLGRPARAALHHRGRRRRPALVARALRAVCGARPLGPPLPAAAYRRHLHRRLLGRGEHAAFKTAPSGRSPSRSSTTSSTACFATHAAPAGSWCRFCFCFRARRSPAFFPSGFSEPCFTTATPRCSGAGSPCP